MRVVRVGAVLVVALGLVLAVSRARATEPPSSGPGTCDAAALSAALTGALRVSGVSEFGCEAGWAYLWANVGTGATEVSVTEVLRLDPQSATWRVVDRGTVCSPGTLPTLIYRRGCFSN